MAAPQGFFIVVTLAVLHCLGFVLCEAGVLGESSCAYWRLASRVAPHPQLACNQR